MISFEQVCNEISTQTKQNSEDRNDIVTADRIFKNTAAFIQEGSFTNSVSVQALENINETPQLVGNVDLQEGNALSKIVEFVSENIPENEFSLEHGVASRNYVVESASKSIARILMGGTLSAAEQISYAREDANRGDLGQMMGGAAWGDISLDAMRSSTAMESFGVGIDNINNDVRINVALTMMRAFRSLPDRMVARVSDPDNIVKINIPEHEVYDLSRSRAATSAERYGSHRQPMIDMFRNPDVLDTSPKPVTFPASAANAYAKDAINADVAANLFDMTYSAAAVGFDHRSYTDILSEGGKIKALIIEVKANNDTDIYSVPVSVFRGSRYVQAPNAESSSVRVANINAKNAAAIRADTETTDGATGSIVTAAMELEGSFAIRLSLNATSTLNIQTGDIELNGSATFDITDDNGVAPDGTADPLTSALLTLLNDATKSHVKVVGYEIDVSYSEENVRKATTAIRQTARPFTFEIPVGRTIVVDVSLQQAEPSSVLNTISVANDLGNTARHLNTYESTLNDVYDRITYEASGNVPPAERVSRQFAAGSLVLPHVVKSEISFDNLDLMRESEVSSDVSAKMSRTLLGIVAELMSKSLYHTNFEAGEQIAMKLVAHNSVVNTVFAIPQYHTTLDNAPSGGRKQRNSSYSIALHDGSRIDVYGVDFDEWKSKVMMFPVRDSNPSHITSFATTRDRGTFVGNYTLTEGGAANRRFIVNSREVGFIQAPVGSILELTNLDTYYPNLFTA